MSSPGYNKKKGADAAADQSSSDDRLISPEECAQIINRLQRMTNGQGSILVYINSTWSGELRWARNHVSLTSDRRNIQVTAVRTVNEVTGSAWTNQLDDVSLQSIVQAAERMVTVRSGILVDDYSLPAPDLPFPDTAIWSDSTFSTTARMRSDVANALIRNSESEELLSAGYLSMSGVLRTESPRLEIAANGAVRDVSAEEMKFLRYTMAECSTTVRHPRGLGSGWAGLSGYDWSTIDGSAIADRALKKAIASLNPVAVEPGRYTVILEPQAVYDLIGIVVAATSRAVAEFGRGPFALEPDRSLGIFYTKLGLKIVDDRITLSHNPEDPDLGVLPKPGMTPVTWVEKGVLKTLTNERIQHALPHLNENLASLPRLSFRMSGGDASVEQMIASTRRGLIVTRFSSMRMLDDTSLLYTGITRDGLILVEDGKPTRAVRNMRFTDSPLFVFNNVEQLGLPVPVFSIQRNEPLSAIVPPVKANDFAFTSMVEAI